MPTLRTLIAALALTAAATLATTASAGAAAKPKPICKRSNSTTIAQNSLVRIFTRPDPRRRLRGGDRPAGVLEEDRPRAAARLRVRRRLRLEQPMCARAHPRPLRGVLHREPRRLLQAICPPGWEATRRHLNVADVSTGAERSVKVDGRPASNRLLLDARGSIAWPRRIAADEVEVRALDGAGERALDTGAIAPRSLTLSARGRLRWVNGTTPRTALLAPSM